MRVGLLGGSFNPAHEGHVHISEEAIRKLDLNQVWWLVSPQNPLKPKHDMSLCDRTILAQRIARAPRIHVLNLEKDLRSFRTWHTLDILKMRFPRTKFVWLMGADNLEQIPRWARWARIFQTVHVAVFDRSPYSHKVLYGRASKRFARRRLQALHGKAFWATKDSRWIYFSQRRHPASSTGIRRGGMLSSIINSY